MSKVGAFLANERKVHLRSKHRIIPMGDVVRPDFRSKVKAHEASLVGDCGLPVKVYGFEGQYGVALYSADVPGVYRQIELKLTESSTSGAYPIAVFMETPEGHSEAHAMAAAILHVLRMIKYIEG